MFESTRKSFYGGRGEVPPVPPIPPNAPPAILAKAQECATLWQRYQSLPSVITTYEQDLDKIRAEKLSAYYDWLECYAALEKAIEAMRPPVTPPAGRFRPSQIPEGAMFPGRFVVIAPGVPFGLGPMFRRTSYGLPLT